MRNVPRAFGEQHGTNAIVAALAVFVTLREKRMATTPIGTGRDIRLIRRTVPGAMIGAAVGAS